MTSWTVGVALGSFAVVVASVVVVLVFTTVVVAEVATVVPLPSELAHEAVNTRIAARTLTRVVALRDMRLPSRCVDVSIASGRVHRARPDNIPLRIT
jgi:hypothetical protein